MNKLELFHALISGDNHKDRVFFRPILMHFAARFNNTTYGRFASDYKVLVESNIRAMEHFDTDMVSLISDPYRETSAFGAPIEYVDEGVPRCRRLVVNTADDIESLPQPDVYKCERTLDRINGAAYFRKLLGNSVPVSGWIEGPLAESCDLAGVDNMLIRIMTDPDFSNRLMDKCMIMAKQFAKAQIDAGCDLIGIGDAICSQIDESAYDLYVRDRHAELINFIHDRGVPVKLHICGNITHLLGSVKHVGPDIIDLDWQLDLDEARRILGKDIVIGGNLNPVDVQEKKAEEVFAMAKSLVEKYSSEKYLLAAGCEITVLTPDENLMAMRQASYLDR
jgi:MtaA/CmuA family methyltransferase